LNLIFHILYIKITSENNRMIYNVMSFPVSNCQEDDNKINFTDSALKDVGVNTSDEEEENSRYFHLSNLMAEYSTDSGPPSESETDNFNSRPVSCMDSNNSRIIYLDHSDNVTRDDLVETFNELFIDTPEILSKKKQSFKSKNTIKDLKPHMHNHDKFLNMSKKSVELINYPNINIWKSDDCLLYRR
jgi:hypothetical protein